MHALLRWTLLGVLTTGCSITLPTPPPRNPVVPATGGPVPFVTPRPATPSPISEPPAQTPTPAPVTPNPATPAPVTPMPVTLTPNPVTPPPPTVTPTPPVPTGSGLPTPGPGQLVFTEFMANPSVASDSDGEWFELHNPTSTDLDLLGCSVEDNNGVFAVDVSLVLEGGGYASFARSALPGFAPDVVFDSLQLANGADVLTVLCDGLVVDAIDYGTGFDSVVAGVSFQLDPGFLDAGDNDDGSLWCASSADQGNGDLGSPGIANATCP